MRAIAAVIVVIFHANIFILPDRLYDGQNALDIFNIGYTGVEFFFALSGFIMMYIHQKDIQRPETVSKFALKRIVRIYPLYWIILIALFVASFVVPSVGADVRPDSVIGMFNNFSLFPVHSELMLEVSWTLQHEMLFYFAFSLLLFSRTVGIVVMGIWFAICAAAVFVPMEKNALSVLISPYNLIFLGGMMSALFFKALKGMDGFVLVASGLFLFLFVAISDLNKTFPLNEGWRTVGLGIGASLTIMGLVSAESFGKLKSPDWLNRIGDSSYALYLIHLPVLTAAVPIIKKLGLETILPPIPMLFCLTTGCIIAGLITHYLLEKPLIKMTSALFFQKKSNNSQLVRQYYPPIRL